MARARTRVIAGGTTAGGTTISAAGQGLAHRGGLISAFVSGALVVAAILAGPIGNTEAIGTPVMLGGMHDGGGAVGRVQREVPPQQGTPQGGGPANCHPQAT